MTKEELSLAMSYIDDAYINEAYEKKGRSRSFFIKFTALAASLLLVVGLSIPLIPMLIKGGVGGDSNANDSAEGENSGSNDENSEASDIIHTPGRIIYGTGGNIEYISFEENKVNLHYFKSNVGYTHFYLNCFVEKEGVLKRYVVTSDAFYNYSAIGYDGLLLDKINIYINGEPSADGYLPLEIGEYDITLDLTELLTIDGIVLDDKLLIAGFGYFAINQLQ